jgi:hypothetical protein
VIISYPSPQKFGGGIVTESGGNTIHTFQTSGTLSPLSSLTASALVVAGGGGGGANGGGGGAGGYRTGSGITIDTNSIYLVTVGAGGNGGTYPSSTGNATNGSNSIFSSITSTGGGAGYTAADAGGAPFVGGSGGGGGFSTPGAAGNTPSTSPSQGNAGGNGFATTNYGFGGGGGSGGAGVAGTSVTGGNGGAGTANSISGTSVTYAGGGGGGIYFASTPGTGAAGGGNGGSNGSAGTSATANTGSGGGGGGSNGSNLPPGGNGGSGIVIISYAGSTQLMAGGTVTITGGNVIHTFTSSGYLTPLDFVGNSLRFRSSASAFLNRTPTVSGNRRTWTFSTWLKRGTLGTFAGVFGVGVTSNGGYASVFNCIRFTDANTLSIFEYDINTATTFYRLDTTQVFRDPAAWYHIVFAFDSTQATASNRWKLYVNGTQVTAFSSTTYPSQNYDTLINTATKQNEIGLVTNVYFDGYMTEVQLIDGQALTPNSFGTFNSFGVWQPIVYGGSYGTNGFYLPFNNNSTGSALSVNYLVVAGGGGAAGTGGGAFGGGGGGGAGGFLTGTTSIVSTLNYAVTVGAGGAAGGAELNGSQGANSVFSSLTSIGGGGGGAGTSGAGGNGGSGGGGNGSNAVGVTLLGGTATSGQGFNGGNGSTNNDEGGGGGGASAVGTAGVAATSRGNGGAGTASSISGSSVTYAGGGGGGGNNTAVGGTGGAGGGGSSPNSQGAGGAGTANTGGGGAGGYATSANQAGGAGGSGIVIVSYAGTQRFIGGTVTTSGGNIIHTFTSSGVLTSIFSDQSPQGNNWTPNNFNVTTPGSTYDSMTDVPTLTSTTAANYCVWNPLDRNYYTTQTAPSEANMRLYGLGGRKTTFGITTGKWYAEYTLSGGGTPGSNFPCIGLREAADDGYWCGYASNSVGYQQNGTVYYNGNTVAQATGQSFTTGDVLGLAYDADTNRVWFAKNGTWIGTGSPNPATNTSPIYTFPSSALRFMAGDTIDTSYGGLAFNAGQRPFTYTPPTGFLALNTFNL